MASAKKEKLESPPIEAPLDSAAPASAIPDPEIARVADALKMPEPAPAAPEVLPPSEVFAMPTGYRVTAWCGELHRDGVVYKTGDAVPLSHEQAKALGKNVEPLS